MVVEEFIADLDYKKAYGKLSSYNSLRPLTCGDSRMVSVFQDQVCYQLLLQFLAFALLLMIP
jgi:hypothetical protein